MKSFKKIMTTETLTLDQINAQLADVAENLRGQWDDFMALDEDQQKPDFAVDIVAAIMPRMSKLLNERQQRREAILQSTTIAELGASLGWSEQEIKHVEDAHQGGTEALDYGDECIVLTHSGREIRSPAYPAECSYIRIVEQGFELAYWSSDEWKETPEEVMGAIMGAIKHDIEAPDTDLCGGIIDTTRERQGQRSLL